MPTGPQLDAATVLLQWATGASYFVGDNATQRSGSRLRMASESYLRDNRRVSCNSRLRMGFGTHT